MVLLGPLHKTFSSASWYERARATLLARTSKVRTEFLLSGQSPSRESLALLAGFHIVAAPQSFSAHATKVLPLDRPAKQIFEALRTSRSSGSVRALSRKLALSRNVDLRDTLETCACPLSGGTALRNSHAAHCAHCLPTHDAPRRSTSGTSGGPRASSPPPPSLLTYDAYQALLRTRLSKGVAAAPSLDPPRSPVAHPQSHLLE